MSVEREEQYIFFKKWRECRTHGLFLYLNGWGAEDGEAPGEKANGFWCEIASTLLYFYSTVSMEIGVGTMIRVKMDYTQVARTVDRRKYKGFESHIQSTVSDSN